jgi:HEAT repeats
MKGNRPKLVLVAVAAAALGVVLILSLRTREPVYQGEPLSFWFGRLSLPVVDPRHQQALAAIRQMGPPIIPSLLRGYKPRPQFYQMGYDRTWRKLPTEVQHYMPMPHWLRQSITTYALQNLGPDALPSLCQLYGDPRFIDHRLLIDRAIRGISRHADASAVPPLLDLTQGSLGEVRGEAAMAFGRMGTNAGPQVTVVVAALTRLLADAHPYAREEAAYALWLINRDTNAVSVLVTQFKKTSDLRLSMAILNHFYEMKRAGDAYPVISNVLNRSAKLRKVFAPNPFE